MLNELNDPRLIEQAKKSHVSEAEPLYWALEDDLYSNNIPRAKGIYDMFLYLGAYHKDIIVKGLRPIHRDRLKEIAYELHGNGESMIKQRNPIMIRQAMASRSLPFKNEKELQIYLAKNPDVLKEALKDDIYIHGIEVETDFEYRCDIVAKSDRIFYPIELKIKQATHEVVSQINKYCWYFYRKLRYNAFRDIQGIVIGNGIDSWAINELRRDGHWCFTMVSSGDDIRLERVE